MILPELNKLIELYEKQLSNLKWHLEVNSSRFPEDKEVVEQRIKDKESVIYDLNELYKLGLERIENVNLNLKKYL